MKQSDENSTMTLQQQVNQLAEVLTQVYANYQQLYNQHQLLSAQDMQTKQVDLAALSALQQQHDTLLQSKLVEQEQLQQLLTRYNALVLSHESLRQDFDRLTTDLQHMQQQTQQLTQARNELQQKNAYARDRVQAIMQRLTSLSE